MRRVVVTGLGVLTANAIGVDAFESALLLGSSGIGPVTRFDKKALKVTAVAEVKGFEPNDYMAVAAVRKTDRFAQFGIASAKMALEQSGLINDETALKDAIVIIGSGLGGQNFHEETMMSVIENDFKGRVAASSVPRITPNAVSAYIALQHKIQGKNQVISTACSSSTQAIGEAFRNVRDGSCNVAITGGVEATITYVNIAMYEAMMVLGSSQTENIQQASRPFDKTRNGFVMGEGAGCLVLEELEHAKARGARIIAEIAGFGSTCGAYHMVAPNPTGEDAAETMAAALVDGNTPKDEVDYIAAHGTSTKFNDLAETHAIKKLLGNRAYKVPVSSIKSMIGHTIGASGAIQAVAACLSIRSGFLPPTINLNNPDEECDLDYIANAARKKKPSVILSNSFGFGSNNACLLIKEV